MFLKRKCCRKIKGQGCGWTKQCLNIYKKYAALPTVFNRAVFLTAVIDAVEGQEVATANIPGAIMQANMDRDVRVQFAREMVEMLLQNDVKSMLHASL